MYISPEYVFLDCAFCHYERIQTIFLYPNVCGVGSQMTCGKLSGDKTKQLLHVCGCSIACSQKSALVVLKYCSCLFFRGTGDVSCSIEKPFVCGLRTHRLGPTSVSSWLTQVCPNCFGSVMWDNWCRLVMQYENCCLYHTLINKTQLIVIPSHLATITAIGVFLNNV